MTPKQKRTLILGSIIGTLFACYDDDEKTRLHNELHSRIGKGVRCQVRAFSQETVINVAHEEGGKIWADTVDHFADKHITIEASSCILALWNLDEKALTKHYGMSAKLLGTWARPSRREDAAELEKQSNNVARFVFNAVNDLYGIEEKQKLSAMDKIALARKQHK